MNVDYFIKKFEAIPEALWCTGAYEYGDRCCVLGHCGFHYTIADDGLATKHDQALEGLALIELFHKKGLQPTNINDGEDGRYAQSSPKERILAALRAIGAAERCRY